MTVQRPLLKIIFAPIRCLWDICDKQLIHHIQWRNYEGTRGDICLPPNLIERAMLSFCPPKYFNGMYIPTYDLDVARIKIELTIMFNRLFKTKYKKYNISNKIEYLTTNGL